MARATDPHIRLALAHMARLGASASDIGRQLGLPLSTVRDLMRRVPQTEADQVPAAMLPRYQACGRRSLVAPPLLESALELRRCHPRWGAGRIRVELSRMNCETDLPSERTIQRWLRKHGLAPARQGRSGTSIWQRAEHPHDVWEVDAADQKRLADGRMISWLRVVDECSGAVLHTHVFSL
jgi:hypothetical protein